MTEYHNKALSLKYDVSTVAVRAPVEETKKIEKKILDEDQYIEV